MDRLRSIQVFLEVARRGSFAGAARHLGMSKASVTKHVAALEQLLAARLLNRTPKKVGLTVAGLTALDGGKLLVHRFEQIEAEVRDSVRSPKGVVRVGTPPAFGTHHLVPLIAAFADRHPDIQIALSLDVGSTDLIAEGLDLAVRIAPDLPDAGYVAQPLAKAPQVMVASPAYLRKRRPPGSLADLARHNCLVHSVKSPTSIWRFTGPDGPASVRVRGTLHSNFGEALQHAALVGHGISVHPYYMVSDALAAGNLIVVLPQYEPEAHDIHVIYPARQNLPVRVRRFVEFLKEWARTPPEWSVPERFGRSGAAGRPVSRRSVSEAA